MIQNTITKYIGLSTELQADVEKLVKASNKVYFNIFFNGGIHLLVNNKNYEEVKSIFDSLDSKVLSNTIKLIKSIYKVNDKEALSYYNKYMQDNKKISKEKWINIQKLLGYSTEKIETLNKYVTQENEMHFMKFGIKDVLDTFYDFGVPSITIPNIVSSIKNEEFFKDKEVLDSFELKRPTLYSSASKAPVQVIQWVKFMQYMMYSEYFVKRVNIPNTVKHIEIYSMRRATGVDTIECNPCLIVQTLLGLGITAAKFIIPKEIERGS